MRYHPHAKSVAVVHADFREAVRRAAGAALAAAELTPHQRQLLKDLRREESRYQFRALDQLMDALALLPNDASEFAFLEAIRTAIDARKQRNSTRALAEALLAETEAEAQANPPQLEVALGAHDLPHIEHALDATIRERDAAEELIHSLSAERFALLHRTAR